MIEKYCENNKFNRVRFALDVKNGKISSRELSTVFHEIDVSIQKNLISSPYIGTKCISSKKKSEWNRHYLEHLIAEVSCTEVFNKASISHLLQVANYVNSTGKRIFIKLALCLFISIVVFTTGFVVGWKKNSNLEELKSENLILKEQVEEFQKIVHELKRENEELKQENSSLQSKLDDINKILRAPSEESPPPTATNNSESEEDDELAQIINRALKGENVYNEFQSSSYSTEDLQQKALEMGLTKKDAERLIGNPANASKFNLEAFKE